MIKIIKAMFRMLALAATILAGAKLYKKQLNRNKKMPAARGVVSSIDNGELTERQVKILDFVAKKKSVGMADIAKQFSDVTDRTLRRDLTRLSDARLVMREGSTKDARYFV